MSYTIPVVRFSIELTGEASTTPRTTYEAVVSSVNRATMMKSFSKTILVPPTTVSTQE